MVQIQLLEFTLIGLVNAQEGEPESRDSEDNYQRIEKLFTLPAGQLRRRAKRLKTANSPHSSNRRSTCGTAWCTAGCMLSAIDVASGRSTLAAERADLAAAEGASRRVQSELQALFGQTLKDAGAELEPTLEEWQERFGSPPPPG